MECDWFCGSTPLFVDWWLGTNVSLEPRLIRHCLYILKQTTWPHLITDFVSFDLNISHEKPYIVTYIEMLWMLSNKLPHIFQLLIPSEFHD